MIDDSNECFDICNMYSDKWRLEQLIDDPFLADCFDWSVT